MHEMLPTTRQVIQCMNWNKHMYLGKASLTQCPHARVTKPENDAVIAATIIFELQDRTYIDSNGYTVYKSTWIPTKSVYSRHRFDKQSATTRLRNGHGRLIQILAAEAARAELRRTVFSTKKFQNCCGAWRCGDGTN
jgi:hypothetical protein